MASIISKPSCLLIIDQDLIEEHEQKNESDEQARDFIDVYLAEIKNQANKKDTTFTSISNL